MSKVCVFGGTGFLGRRIVDHLLDQGFPVRIASRHPGRGRSLPRGDGAQLESVRADVEGESTLAEAVNGTGGVVNAVSLYVERGVHTFHSVHVRAAANLAAEARRAGVEHFVHVSGVGADTASRSPYIRSRGEGELAVQAAFPGAKIVRPAVMFGLDDAFLNTALMLLKRLPAFPIFGSGNTRLQPVSVEDVGEAIVRVLGRDAAVYELGGPRIYSYQQLIQTISRQARLRRVVFPVPFGAWHMLARIAELLPTPPLSRNQVDLMKIDTVASTSMPGFDVLGMSPQPLEQVLQAILARRSGRPQPKSNAEP